MSVYFNPQTEEISETMEDGFVVLPDEVGIIWAEDQSLNQITFDLEEADYTFCPSHDIPLLEQYTDQLKELM